MRLDGSCHRRAVRFSLSASEPVPYQRCTCSICRKTQGGGGYAINLGANAASLAVTGAEHVRRYHAVLRDENGERRSPAERAFCGERGGALWLFDPTWPELIHPFASAIDTELPEPPETTHLMLSARPGRVRLDARPGDERFDDFPERSLADWHRDHAMSAPED